MRAAPASLMSGIALSVLLSGCGQSAGTTSTPGVVRVVAAENFWGSIASQLGGTHARVTSIVSNPDTDPHSYEPTTADALALARARFVVENGVGYDPWAPRLLAADDTKPTVLDVGTLLGLHQGDNPHRWYDPGDVRRVVVAMTHDFQTIDPRDAGYFARRRDWFEHVALAPYDSLIAAIRARFAGTPVGASESIFAMLSPALGLDLVTPPTYLRAVSEGTEVSAADKQTIDRQIAGHLIDVYVYNRQNVTPDVRAQLAEVRARHIPTATITETLDPTTDTFEQWQVAELQGIQAALAAAGGG